MYRIKERKNCTIIVQFPGHDTLQEKENRMFKSPRTQQTYHISNWCKERCTATNSDFCHPSWIQLHSIWFRDLRIANLSAKKGVRAIEGCLRQGATMGQRIANIQAVWDRKRCFFVGKSAGDGCRRRDENGLFNCVLLCLIVQDFGRFTARAAKRE